MGAEFVILTLPPLTAAVLAALACALPGNWLLLRRQAMLGDAVAHSVLPGLVVAFVLTGTLSPVPLALGALAAALVAVGLVEAIRRRGRVDPGTAMGAAFTTLFALGVLLLELSGAARVHLDVEHALMGNLESLVWLDATGWSSLLDGAALRGLPPQIGVLAATLLGVASVLWLLRRPLFASTFDEDHARVTGQRPALTGLALVAATATAAVAAFQAVGAIVVIAMLTVPPAAARLLTDRFETQLRLSLLLAAGCAAGGTILGGYGPLWLGAPASVSAAGTIAVLGGLALALAAGFGPRRRPAAAGRPGAAALDGPSGEA
ncbi:metal ABC transporter permease [Rubellimicrobium sp. CFH 75288]|uniref:metal ABC transporter permease n=1 Tax=Rubellimicrobium sp. CFH 75288 TaxID=2697034 RepID=UPI0014123941|nr:metal ABC transporter permease [Rubellimicrobium sp. CFH 75288]NAZ35443.1 metal ABC transporter permease [Rubellimicrobium sp. CFH 75288]